MSSLKIKTKGIVTGAALLVAAGLAWAAPETPKNGNNNNNNSGAAAVAPKVRPKVEVVFVLDTTGSMSGLLQGAKDKIWSIARHIASAKPTPEVTIGLVAYRDKGDAYVTKTFGLSADMDLVFERLMGFRADGGGDTPEHVNKGLYEAVYNMQWSPNSMKMVFLVGDAPPHTDYKDGFDYDKIMKEASRREIRVHAVRCGTDGTTETVWREIAKLGHGTYASIAGSGGVVAVTTPVDSELAELGRKLNDTAVVYGDSATQHRVATKAATAAAAPASTAADRSGFYATSGAAIDEADVLEKAAAGGGEGLAKMDTAKLPEPMKAMAPEERKEYVVKKKAEREVILKQMKEASVRRDAYIREQTKDKKEAGFDDVVTGAISAQGKDYGLAY